MRVLDRTEYSARVVYENLIIDYDDLIFTVTNISSTHIFNQQRLKYLS